MFGIEKINKKIMKNNINGVTTKKSIEVMNAHKFNHLLRIAEQNENVMSKLRKYLYNVFVESSSVKDDLDDYLDVDEDEADMWKCDIEKKYGAYVDLDDEYDISEVYEECEIISDNCNEILDCIDNGCFVFEDWGYNYDFEWGNGSSILDYDFDDKRNELIISLSSISQLGFYLENEAEIQSLRIRIDQLLTANHSDVA